MAGLWIENSGYLQDILRLLGAEHWDCSWLMTELECYDYGGWSGCEKWAKRELVLPNEEFLRDVNLRNMQFVWGIFSAIPAEYSRERILAEPLPSFEDNVGNWKYGGDVLLPQHPLAFLEIMSEDSTSVTVIARDEALLRPLTALPEWTEDAEASNRKFHQMSGIVERLAAEKGYGRMSAHLRQNLLFSIWQTLYHKRPGKEVCEAEVRKLYDTYME